jgi:nucleoside-diphosphate-sugar epimerase
MVKVESEMNSLDHSRILMTGAGGFLGSHIIDELVKLNADVVGVDLKKGLESGNLKGLESKMQAVEADITNIQQMQSINGHFDYVVHLAAMAAPRQCDENPGKAFDINVHGTYNLLKRALDWKATKFVFASTAHVYGISPKYIPTDERHPLALQDTYTTTKIMGESLCQLFYGNHGLAYTVLRLFNSYGPRQSADYFIPAMIMKAKTGHILLQGRYITKDFVYVRDVVDAYLKSATSDYVGEVNIGSGVQTALEVVARRIAKAFDAELSFADTMDKGPTHMQCDTSRAKYVFGWNTVTPLEKGLELTIESFRRED